MAQDKDLNRELLKIAGFEGDEIEAILPDWMMCSECVKLNDDDIRHAIRDYIPDNWDVQYRGVRKMIGAYLRELIEITKTPDYKGFPNLIMVAVLNGFFHKAVNTEDRKEKGVF